ncbi:MAG: MBL fold metallo-hydrolase [Spirochaetes bacterium]|nr:MBL fold metallo-hydrolase [Spirochaetota bacterium]
MKRLSLTFWGVRGSIPVPGPSTMRYGGNTACFDLRSEDGDWIIFDAGTGLRVLGESLDLSKKYEINILISHPHWDHINGIPFFAPIYIPGNRITFYGPGTSEMTLQEILSGQMRYSYFPVRTVELLAEIEYRQIEQERFEIGNFQITTITLNHPVACLGYRVRYEDKLFVYLGDNEPYFNIFKDKDNELQEFVENLNERLIEFVRDADALVADSQYLPSEYEAKRGWGHSTTHQVMNLAIKAKVKKLFFFHHEPVRTDDDLDEIVSHYRKKVIERGYSIEIHAAMEQTVFNI